MNHEITVETDATYPQMGTITCTCGYRCNTHERWAGTMVADHKANLGVIHPSLIHS